jgi:hypothetical protein
MKSAEKIKTLRPVQLFGRNWLKSFEAFGFEKDTRGQKKPKT